MPNTEKFAIGIDTGGTYTDAVIIDTLRHKVIASAKALTTKGDLAVGVSAALQSVLSELSGDFDIRQIGMVSVSTTLATNAIVEGHGSEVGIVLIGFDAGMVARTGIAKAFPYSPLIVVGGGHQHNGDRQAPLDKNHLTHSVMQISGQVSAFAIAGAFAVRNPEHEREAAEMILRLTNKPVSLSCELTSALDAPRRALTAVLNARLIGRITLLIEAVKTSMVAHEIVCPLMVVKGDGSLGRAETVAFKPIETLLSGPAASLIGAHWLSGLNDFILCDIGGTTTDIAILRHGVPQIADHGAEVGGWRTLVRALEVKTIGLGGDSEVALDGEGKLLLQQQRVVPISLLGQRFPRIIEKLEAETQADEISALAGRFVLLPFGEEKAASQATSPMGLSQREKDLLERIEAYPQALAVIAPSLGSQRAMVRLCQLGLVQLSGFTPSDAAHVLKLQNNWSRSAALYAAMLLVRRLDMRLPDETRVQSFCQSIWSKLVETSALALISAATGIELRDNILARTVAAGETAIDLGAMRLSCRVPVVAVGGPAKVFYPEVARRLSSEVVFVDYHAVANAVGAAAGRVVASVRLEVVGDGSGLFQVFGGFDPSPTFSSGDQALLFASDKAQELALSLAEAQGAGEVVVTLQVEKKYIPDRGEGHGLLSAHVVADAVGQPFQGLVQPISISGREI